MTSRASDFSLVTAFCLPRFHCTMEISISRLQNDEISSLSRQKSSGLGFQSRLARNGRSWPPPRRRPSNHYYEERKHTKIMGIEQSYRVARDEKNDEHMQAWTSASSHAHPFVLICRDRRLVRIRRPPTRRR